MSTLAWVIVVASLSVAPCDLKPTDAIATKGHIVTIADVMDVSCLAPAHRDQVAGLVIARLPATDAPVTLTRSALKSLVHRRAPGISFVPSPEDTHAIAFVREKASLEPQATETSCVQAAHNIDAGQIISDADLATAPCDETPDARTAIAFDRTHGVLRALRPIGAGDKFGRLDAAGAAFDKGDELTLSVNLGAVRIVRKVVAVQAGPAGARIFVQDESGAVFAAPTFDREQEGVSQ